MADAAAAASAAAAGPLAEFEASSNIDLWDRPDQSSGLATQVAAGQHVLCPAAWHATVCVAGSASNPACAPVEVYLPHDGYRAWLLPADGPKLRPATAPWAPPPPVDEVAIQARIPAVLAFVAAAGAVPNRYLWGGTTPPNYDCSGLMQAAFASQAIPLPRDSYQQAEFVRRVEVSQLIPGDLLFFGDATRVRHVAVCTQGPPDAVTYAHSSGKDNGRNGIGVDVLAEAAGPVAAHYCKIFKWAGRVVRGYQPPPLPPAGV